MAVSICIYIYMCVCVFILYCFLWGPFCGCPCHKSTSTVGSILGPMIFGNSHVLGLVNYVVWAERNCMSVCV